MADYVIHNKSGAFIHAATRWANIVQQYRNGIAPGTSVTISGAHFGWQDFTIRVGTKELEFSHGDDLLPVLEIAGGTALLVGGVFVAAAFPPAAALGLAAAEAGGDAIAEFISSGLTISPEEIKACWGPDGYEITVFGLNSIMKKNGDEYLNVVEDTMPIGWRWKNKVSGTTGYKPSLRYGARFAIQAYNGKYLSFQPDHSIQVNRTAVGPWETVEAYCVERQENLAFKTFHGRYLCSELDGNLTANRETPDEWETFHVEPRADGRRRIRDYRNSFVMAVNGGDDRVVTSSKNPDGPWEGFVFHQVG